jgi:hypothetical protein
MHFSTLVFASFAGAFLAPFGRAVASEASIPVPENEVEGLAVSDMGTHMAPAIWTFELDEDVIETPELVAEVQEAFVLAANEAHDITDFQFNTVDIKQVMHEKVDLGDDAMMLGDTEEEGDEGADDKWIGTRSLRGIVDTFVGARRSNRHFRPNNKKKKHTNLFKWRDLYSVNVHYGCKLCSNDDDALMSSPMNALTPQFYELEHGQVIMKRWQKAFCGKLRRIKMLRKPARCFIYLDLDHQDDPADEPNLFLPVSEN